MPLLKIEMFSGAHSLHSEHVVLMSCTVKIQLQAEDACASHCIALRPPAQAPGHAARRGLLILYIIRARKNTLNGADWHYEEGAQDPDFMFVSLLCWFSPEAPSSPPPPTARPELKQQRQYLRHR